MEILSRINKQIELINSLVAELEVERSYRGVERLVQLVVQALLDLGLMVTSALKGRYPKTYSEIGYLLNELGIIDESDAELMRSMAGLRNILVHEYVAVDREKVLKFSKQLKQDALRLASKIVGRLREMNVDPEESVSEVVEKLSVALRGRVRAAYLFGGRVKGYVLKGDYDIAVLMNEDYNLYELGNLQILIAEALGVSEDRVDLICLNNAPPDITIEALNGVPIVIEDLGEVLELEVRTLMKLLDLTESLKIFRLV